MQETANPNRRAARAFWTIVLFLWSAAFGLTALAIGAYIDVQPQATGPYDDPYIETIEQARRRGREDAERDTSRGHFRVKAYGLRLSNRQYEELLRNRYGVDTDIVGGCVMLTEQLAYWSTYNEFAVTEINKHYGKNVFDECLREASNEVGDIH